MRDQEFYLSCLIADNLITEHTKFHYLQEISKQRSKEVRAIELISYHVSPEYQAIMLYHAIPLGRQLHLHLLPKLKQPNQSSKTMSLDDTLSMEEHPEPLRIAVFCQFFTGQLTCYLQQGQLVNIPVKKDGNPSYIAALMHALLTEALDYFKLSNTAFASNLHNIMQGIKKDLQEHFQLISQSDSLWFSRGFDRTPYQLRIGGQCC